MTAPPLTRAPFEPVRSLSHPLYRRGRPRVRPWPFDATLDGMGVMLGGRKKGSGPTLNARKPEDQGNVAPTDYGENAQNPVFGRTYTWRTFHLGMGLAVEDEEPSKAESRYRWAINADCSVANRLVCQGPEVTVVTPSPSRDAVNGVSKFFDLKGVLYWLNGQYLTRLDNDTSATVVGDFGAGVRAVDVSVFASNGLDGYTAAYIAALDATGADTKLWTFDGTALYQNSDPQLLARNVVNIGRHLYRANRVNQISRVDVDSDPWVFANWGAENQFLIGDKQSPIVGMAENAVGVLIVFKTDGIYSIDDSGEAIRYFPFMRFGRSDENGLTWGAYLNDLYVRYGESLYRLRPDMAVEEVGPNRYGTIGGPVHGRTTAFAGHGNFHGYTGLWNPDTDTAFLLKYGAHQPDELGEPQRVEAWHGSITPGFAANRITQLYVSGYRAPAQHNRMYVGFRDGRVGWFTLPCVPDPAACDQYRFSVNDGWVVVPNWHGGFPASDKPLRYVAVTGDNLNGTNYATVQYRLDPISADATSGMPWLEVAGHFDTLPSERIEFPDSTKAKVAAFRVTVHNTDPAESPLVTSLSLRWRLTTDFQQVYDMYVAAEDGLVARDGTPLRRGAKIIRDKVRAMAESGQVFELVLPDEEIKLVSIYDYGEAIGWYERGKRWMSMLKIGVAEDATGSSYGTYGRLRSLRYGDLRGMKYGDLRNL